MKIVYCGELVNGGTCKMRCEALRRLGHEVVEVDSTYVPSGVSGLGVRVLRKLGHTADPTTVNERLLASVRRVRPDVVWIDKGLSITPRTLREIRTGHPESKIAHYSPDDMGGKHNQSRQYLEGIPLYDLHVSTKSFNVSELQALGARDVLLLNNAHCPIVHRPIPVTPEEKKALGGEVGFIGSFEEERANSLLFLARHGINVRVWTGGWESWSKRNSHPNMVVENRSLWNEDYAKAICSFAINLGFLRKLNRDLQTQRSIEIPACGGFMLAERTSEHLALFEEGVEAEFFGKDEELLEKCIYYLAHSDERQAIAAAGRKRCQDSGYSYEVHVETALRRLSKLRGNTK